MWTTGSAWSDEAVALMRAKWTDGLSATQIAGVLGRDLNVKKTRNAVIGKLHRLGLAGRVQRHNSKQRPPPRPRPVRVPTFSTTPPAPLPSALKTIAALGPIDPALGVLKLSRFTCRHPIGDPKHDGFAFCGRTCEETYCAEHMRLNYQAPSRSTSQHRAAERLAFYLDSRGRRQAAAAI